MSPRFVLVAKPPLLTSPPGGGEELDFFMLLSPDRGRGRERGLHEVGES